MTMHLEGPWLTMTGKRKTKRRWASAEQKRKHDELEASWQAIKAKHAPRTTVVAPKTKVYTPPRPLYRGSDQPRLPSLDTGVKGAVTVRASQQYTGTKVKGIATMHKSNAVPVFTDEQAVDISRMRRG
jgi:hypothetical protein